MTTNQVKLVIGLMFSSYDIARFSDIFRSISRQQFDNLNLNKPEILVKKKRSIL